ncbi:MAG TPA: molecular chaperone TorD family protein [Symbiobacteriaceae bacterium]|nr:molecular chaperone TorD family protein [Symbiobacteriaceae bacterium]
MENRADASEALARSNMYGLLSRITRTEIDAELLAAFRSPAVTAALGEAGVDLESALAGPDDPALLEQLSTAYTHLFLLTVNPHESVQRGEGRLWGERTVAANAFMEAAGLAVEGETSLLPDHVSMELAVMQHLAAEQAASLAAGDQARAADLQALQNRYLKEHLGAWGVTFFAAAEKAASHPFYRQMAGLARGFLHSELA